jgi:hypothetical protein
MDTGPTDRRLIGHTEAGARLATLRSLLSLLIK